MSRPIAPVSVPARIPASARRTSRPAALVSSSALALPSLGPLPSGANLYFGTALVNSSGRVQDRAAVAVLGWARGDHLLVTVVGTSVVFQRRPDGVFAMAAKPYVVLPVAVRSRCVVPAGSRVLVAADPDQDVLVVHSPSAVHTMLGQFHVHLAGGDDQ
jgi:bifunctional DNA-binding transcriptional regulator/antitoxin component of YhaV-PrlF toxin-antitoxin module